MTTHNSVQLLQKMLIAMADKTREEGLPISDIPEISDSIVYNADNPGNLDVGQPDGSRDDTLVYNGGNIRGELSFNLQEGRLNWDREAFTGGKGYRLEGFENFSTDPDKTFGNTTFKLTGNGADNTFTIHSGKSNIKAGAGDDTMRVFAGADHTLHGGEGKADVAELNGGNFSLVDVVLDNQAGEDGGRWLVYSDGVNETRIHESTEFVDNGELTRFNKLWRSHRTTISDPNQNARREFDLEGTFKNEDFHGGRGRDNLTGGGGADHFYMESSHRRARGERFADTITDFSKSEKDKVMIDVSAYGLDLNNADLVIARNSRKAQRALSKDNVDFVYDRSTGMLSWNRNGAEEGDGGGLLAIIEGDSNRLGKRQFELV